MWNIDREAAKRAGYTDQQIDAYLKNMNNQFNQQPVNPTPTPTIDKGFQNITTPVDDKIKSVEANINRLDQQANNIPPPTKDRIIQMGKQTLQKAMDELYPNPTPTGDQPTPTPQPRTFSPEIEGQIRSLPPEAQDNMRQVAGAMDDEKILNPKSFAYALGTIQHEANNTWKPIEEIDGRDQATKLGYNGGPDYYGRGYIQLTGKDNYTAMGQRIGVPDLGDHPEKALDPTNAAKITAAFFKDRGVADTASQGDFYDARSGVNGTDQADTIAGYADNYLNAPAYKPPSSPNPPIPSLTPTLTQAYHADPTPLSPPKPPSSPTPTAIPSALKLLGVASDISGLMPTPIPTALPSVIPSALKLLGVGQQPQGNANGGNHKPNIFQSFNIKKLLGFK